ncbi:MAG: ATP-binding protein, partial [Sarcina sp.]
LIAKLSLMNRTSHVEYNEFIYSTIFRALLIVLIIFKRNKVIQKLLKHERICNRVFCSIILLFIFIDINYIDKVFVINRGRQIATIMVIVITVYAIFYNLRSCIIHDEGIYSVISISFVFISVKLMYKFSSYIYMNEGYKGENVAIEEILMFMALVFLLAGVLTLIGKTTIKYREAEEKYNIFFKLVDENDSNNILIYNNNNIQYANKKLKKVYTGDSEYEGDLEELTKNIRKKYSFETMSELHTLVNKKESFVKIVESISGEIVSVSYQNIKPLHEDNKKWNIDVYMIRDMSEEIKNKRKATINDRKFDLVNNTINEMIIVTDIDFSITYINRKCEVFFDVNYNDVVGIKISNYFKFDMIDIGSVFERKITLPNSLEKEVGIKIEEIIDEDSKILGYIFICSDLNEVEIIKKLNERVIEAEKNIIKKDMFTNLSHELRTPIHIIYSSLQLLNMQKENSNDIGFKALFNKYENVMKINSLRLLKLINDIIDISRLDSGTIKCEKNMSNIVTLVENIATSVVPYMKIKNIDFIFDTDLEERYIYCDQEKIERIVLNLMSNAIKFTPKDGVIAVELEFDKKWVKIKIRDTGLGIEKEKCDKIFDRFVQCENGQNLKKGSGIGLSLVKSLVEMHNGEIKLKSEKGVGSEFTIYLPNSSDDENEKAMLSGDYVDIGLLGDISVEFSDIEI